MNVRILRKSFRHLNGTRRWAVNGFDNGVSVIPASQAPKDWGAMVRWPWIGTNGEEILRSADLARHRRLVKYELRQLIRAHRRNARAAKFAA